MPLCGHRHCTNAPKLFIALPTHRGLLGFSLSHAFLVHFFPLNAIRGTEPAIKVLVCEVAIDLSLLLAELVQLLLVTCFLMLEKGRSLFSGRNFLLAFFILFP